MAATADDPVGTRLMRYDVVVVGAGPAGSLAAREVARGGASVLLLDRASFPRSKVCGACVGSGAVEVLGTVGLGGLAASLGGKALHTLVLSAGTRRARVPLGRGYAVSRPVFDEALVAAGLAEGVEFWPRARATIGPVVGGARLVHVSRGSERRDVEGGVVIDATGVGSGVGPAGATSRIRRDSRIGLGTTLPDAGSGIPAGELHMAVRRGGYAGLVAVESGALNVAAAVDPDGVRETKPGALVAHILSSAGIDAPPGLEAAEWRGTPALTRAPADVGSVRLLRVGDAAGYVEPFTGEGICWALDGGVFAGRLGLAGAGRWDPRILEKWRAYQLGALGRAKRLCRATAAALRREWLVHGALAALAVAPGLAAPFVRRAARPPRREEVYAA